MPDVSDFELLKTSDHSRLPQRSVGTWVAVALLLVALAAAAYFGYGYYRRAAQPVAETKAGPKIPDRSLGGAGESIELPPLNETDAVVRELVKKVSSHPSIAAWLATDDLIRHFTIGVADVATIPAGLQRASRRTRVAGGGVAVVARFTRQLEPVYDRPKCIG